MTNDSDLGESESGDREMAVIVTQVDDEAKVWKALKC